MQPTNRTGRISPAGAGAAVRIILRRIPNSSGFTSLRWLHLKTGPLPYRLPRSSVACRASPGTISNVGQHLDRKDRHIATVLAGIRRKHSRPPQQKEPISPEELLDMVAQLTFGLRDMRDRAILLLGYAAGLRRSEIVGLDVNRDDTDDGKGWVEIEEGGAVIIQKTKTGWKEAEVARGSSEQTCPVHALEQWLHFAKLDQGPIFRRVLRDNSGVQADRLSDKHVARLIKKTMLEAGIRPELPDAERLKLFSGHSLRAGLASYAEVDERHVQKQLGHASPQMTRRYQRRRDRFRVNLTKASGL